MEKAVTKKKTAEVIPFNDMFETDAQSGFEGMTEQDQANVSVEQQEGGEEFVQLWREPQAKSASTLDASEIYSDDARRSQHEVELARKLSAFNDVNNKRMHDAAEKLEKTHAFQQQKE